MHSFYKISFAMLVCAVLFMVAHKPALAVTEFCPARLELSPIGSNSTQTFGPAQTYAAELAALGPRSVTAELAFDTNAGWFAADVPSEKVSEKDAGSDGGYGNAQSRWVSPVFEVNFPKAVIVTSAWVTAAESKDDTFGWGARGVIVCLPTGLRTTPTSYRKNAAWSDMLYEPADFKQLPEAPTIIPATPSPAIESPSCAQPFQEATVTLQATPYYPDTSTLEQFPSSGTATVTVALDAQGQPAGALVIESSGNPLFHASTLNRTRGFSFVCGSDRKI